VKKASLYHYIESKEELLTGIYDRILEHITPVVGPIATMDPSRCRLTRFVVSIVPRSR
jgi:AcrR family transcriptional regulator